MNSIFNVDIVSKCSGVELKEIMISRMPKQRAPAYSSPYGRSPAEAKPTPVKFVDRMFLSYEEGRQWLADYCGAQGFVAAKFSTETVIPKTKALDLKIIEAQNKITDLSIMLGHSRPYFNHYTVTAEPFKKSIIDRARNFKTIFRKCSNCSSKVSTQHIVDLPCPVCKYKDFIGE